MKSLRSTYILAILRSTHLLAILRSTYILAVLICAACIPNKAIAQPPPPKQLVHPADLQQVKIDDSFWTPKMQQWSTTTVNDVFDKLEGKYEPDRSDIIEEKAKTGRTRNALLNFDRVAQGKKNIAIHDGPPWYDGLLYETIRGAADLLAEHPDPTLETRIDQYIDHIAAAQDADPDGYLNTWTTLMEPNRRWGRNGGDDKWQHDVYNSGMLMEAAVHYYNTTQKTKLLKVAVRQANYIDAQIGPAPKFNVIPGHGGPEEAILKLYQLFKTHPGLKQTLDVPVNEQNYLAMAKFWIDQRGNYGEKDGSHARKSDSSYNQDQLPVVQQTTIEGHAVRATLLATGLTATAMETGNAAYAHTAGNYWNNIVGRRMFITGGEGAIADGERFGADYFLPESAYLETCASISSAFFSERMNEMQADGKYMDEFERVLYNNFLSGISLDGQKYFYENPLTGNGNKRWSWHSCPCCPPMILKMAGSLPRYIYATSDNAVFINLFIGSEATLNISDQPVLIKQSTGYPWSGDTKIEINPHQSTAFTVNVRIPGWALKQENPFGLYHSTVSTTPQLLVNGKAVAITPQNGYVKIHRTWKAGDVIQLQLPMTPRWVSADDAVQTVHGKLALAAGPIVYGFESVDNATIAGLTLSPATPLMITHRPDLLGGVNIITTAQFTAIPFYTLGNRQPGAAYTVWVNRVN